jgi:DNA-binding NtrC family response regulator
MGEAPPLVEPPQSSDPLMSLPYKQARANLLHDFEARYLKQLIERAGGNVSRAAREARMDRSHLIDLLERHRIKG